MIKKILVVSVNKVSIIEGKLYCGNRKGVLRVEFYFFYVLCFEIKFIFKIKVLIEDGFFFRNVNI